MDDRSADESPYLLRSERDVIRLRNPTEDKRALRQMLTSADPPNRPPIVRHIDNKIIHS